MIGGWYVLGIEHGTFPRSSLLVGPLATRQAAEAAIPVCTARVKRHERDYGKRGPVSLTVCECYAPELFSGPLNAEFWITPAPLEKAG